MLLICQPDSDIFALPYAEALGCEVLITRDPGEARHAATEHSVVWLEWANQFTRFVVNERLPAFTIVRVHDWEVRLGRVRDIKWENVDLIWFINRQTRDDFRKMVDAKAPCIFLPNAVEDVYDCVAEDSKHLAMLSVDVRKRKRYDRAMELMRLLPDYEMTIRTEPNEELDKLMASAPDNVHFDVRAYDPRRAADKSDVLEFFRGKSHVISTSEHEGFHYAIAEGMLCGCAPVVYDWEWGRAKDFWHPYVCDSVEAMAEQVIATKPSAGHAEYVRRLFGPENLAQVLLKQIDRYRGRVAA